MKEGQPPRRRHRWSKPLLAILLFVAAVQGIGASADALEPTVSRWLEQAIEGPASTLGAAWLTTYLLTNGSVVAGLAVSLVESSIVEPAAGFLILAGSRLGAAAFVLLLGIVEFARAQPRPPLRRALGLGFLTYLVTVSVYVPAALLGYVFFDPLHGRVTDLSPSQIDLRILSRAGDVAEDLVDLVGAIPVAVLSAILVFASLRLLDQFLEGVDEERLGARLSRWLRYPVVSFLAGLVFTAVTTSIALSIGALVPLYSRGIVRTRGIVPYLLGAGIGTMADTVLFALLLGSETGLGVVLVLVGSATAVTLVFLVRFSGYVHFIERTHGALTAGPIGALGAVVLLLAIPVLLFMAT